MVVCWSPSEGVRCMQGRSRVGRAWQSSNQNQRIPMADSYTPHPGLIALKLVDNFHKAKLGNLAQPRVSTLNQLPEPFSSKRYSLPNASSIYSPTQTVRFDWSGAVVAFDPTPTYQNRHRNRCLCFGGIPAPSAPNTVNCWKHLRIFPACSLFF